MKRSLAALQFPMNGVSTAAYVNHVSPQGAAAHPIARLGWGLLGLVPDAAAQAADSSAWSGEPGSGAVGAEAAVVIAAAARGRRP